MTFKNIYIVWYYFTESCFVFITFLRWYCVHHYTAHRVYTSYLRYASRMLYSSIIHRIRIYLLDHFSKHLFYWFWQKPYPSFLKILRYEDDYSPPENLYNHTIRYHALLPTGSYFRESTEMNSYILLGNIYYAYDAEKISNIPKNMAKNISAYIHKKWKSIERYQLCHSQYKK